LDAARFSAALPTAPLSDAELDKLVGILLRDNGLVCQMPNPKRQQRRDVFAAASCALIEQQYGAAAGGAIATAFDVHLQIEAGYHAVRHALSAQPLRAEAGDAQVAALLSLLALRSAELLQQADDALARVDALNLGNEVSGIDDHGLAFSIDGVTGAILEGFRIHLTMLAYENGWFGSDDTIALPALGAFDEQAAGPAYTCEALAALWRRWTRLEKRRRYWQGDWSLGPAPQALVAARPIPSADELKLLHYPPTDAELLDWAAFERSREVAIQSFAKSVLGQFDKTKAKGPPGAPTPLAPLGVVREHEIVGAGYLVTVLGQDLFQDQRQFAGLRLVEWLRGYAALGLLADQAAEADGAPCAKHLIWFAPGALQAQLHDLGLSPEAATLFVGHACAHKKSGDLFDTPLLRTDDGGYLLIGLAAINVDPGQVTLCRLNSLQVAPKNKGTVFEDAVTDLFAKQGLKPFTIDTKRGGEPYQLDVLVPWGRYLFVFECKNRGLSDNHPDSGFYFSEQLDEFVEQTHRQVAGLKAHPDMVRQAAGIEVADYEIVPCVLFSQPFSQPEGRDGILVCDWSSVSRFFEDRYFKRLHRHATAPGLPDVLHRIAIYDQWKAQAPTPEAFIEHLTLAPQTVMMLHRAETRDEVFQITANLVAATAEFTKGEEDLDALGELLGFDPQYVRAEQQKVADSIEAIKVAAAANAAPTPG